jgi:hypothetical protein
MLLQNYLQYSEMMINKALGAVQIVAFRRKNLRLLIFNLFKVSLIVRFWNAGSVQYE